MKIIYYLKRTIKFILITIIIFPLFDILFHLIYEREMKIIWIIENLPKYLIFSIFFGMIMPFFQGLKTLKINIIGNKEYNIEKIKKAIDKLNFILSKEEEKVLLYKSKSVFKRLWYFSENKIKVEFNNDNIEISGLYNDVEKIRKMLKI